MNWNLTYRTYVLMLAGLSCGAGLLQAGAPWVRVQTDSGEEISASALDRNERRIVLDVAGQLLQLPMDRVIKVEEKKASAAEAPAPTAALYNLGRQSRLRSFEEQVQQLQESVVSIETPRAAGSGFFVTGRGHIVTNVHVVEQETRISITRNIVVNGNPVKQRISNIRILALSPLYDLALLQAPEADGPYPAVSLHGAQSLQRGQMLFAMGNPMGLERSVSRGIL